jgi:hypothetical protein
MTAQFRASSGLAAVLALVLMACPPPAVAHHSFAMYDQAKLVILNGTVREFQWSNPHSVIFVIRGGMGGTPEDLWSVELPTSPGNLSRLGWSKHSLKPGDKVAIAINPLRDGRHGGSLKTVTLLATGEVLTVGAPPAATAPTR